MTESDRFRINPDFIYREIAGESLLVPTGKAAENFFGIASINEAGAYLWQLLEQERSVEELKKLLSGKYDLEEDQSLRDVTEFLEDAVKGNMVMRC